MAVPRVLCSLPLFLLLWTAHGKQDKNTDAVYKQELKTAVGNLNQLLGLAGRSPEGSDEVYGDKGGVFEDDLHSVMDDLDLVEVEDRVRDEEGVYSDGEEIDEIIHMLQAAKYDMKKGIKEKSESRHRREAEVEVEIDGLGAGEVEVEAFGGEVEVEADLSRGKGEFEVEGLGGIGGFEVGGDLSRGEAHFELEDPFGGKYEVEGNVGDFVGAGFDTAGYAVDSFVDTGADIFDAFWGRKRRDASGYEIKKVKNNVKEKNDDKSLKDIHKQTIRKMFDKIITIEEVSKKKSLLSEENHSSYTREKRDLKDYLYNPKDEWRVAKENKRQAELDLILQELYENNEIDVDDILTLDEDTIDEINEKLDYYEKQYEYENAKTKLESLREVTLKDLIHVIKKTRTLIPTEIDAAAQGALAVGQHLGYRVKQRLEPIAQAGYRQVFQKYVNLYFSM